MENIKYGYDRLYDSMTDKCARPFKFRGFFIMYYM